MEKDNYSPPNEAILSQITIADHNAAMEDPIERTKQHKLIDIITIIICAVICGADTWVDVETYGRAKYEYNPARYHGRQNSSGSGFGAIPLGKLCS